MPTLVAILDRPLLPLSENHDHHPPNGLFRKDTSMHLKILLSSKGLKISRSEPHRRVPDYHFFGKWIPMAFLH
jgi:hypothetical protein